MLKKRLWKITIGILFLAFGGLLFSRFYVLSRVSPCHAPVLYHINSGQMAFLETYDMDPLHPQELDADQPAGTFQLTRPTDIVWWDTSLWRDTSTHTAGAFLPNRGFLILDLYNPDHIKAHFVREGIFTMREYTIAIESKNGEFILTVTGGK